MNDELEHYGVLGMKWGVRKDPQTAYNKAGQKMEKLDKKVQKTTTKAQKKMEKAWTRNNSAQRAILLKSFKKWRAAGATNRAVKAYAKEQKAESKAMRWANSVSKAFDGVKVSDINPKYEELGQKYANKTIQDLMAANTSINSMYDIYDRNKTALNR